MILQAYRRPRPPSAGIGCERNRKQIFRSQCSLRPTWLLFSLKRKFAEGSGIVRVRVGGGGGIKEPIISGIINWSKTKLIQDEL